MAIRRIFVSAVLLFTLTACGAKPSNSISATGEKAKSSPAPSTPAAIGNLKELIIGKWVMAKDEKPQIEWENFVGKPDRGRVLEITKRGEFNVAAEDAKVVFINPRKYDFLKNDAAKVVPIGALGTLESSWEKMAKTVRVKVTSDQLTLTDEKGKTDKYQRSKSP